MADFGKSMRNLLISGVKAVNNAASSIASTTRYKVDEFNLQDRRKELLKSASDCAYTLWQRGVALPEELDAILKQVDQLDRDLADMRAQAENDRAARQAEAAEKKAAAPAAPAEPEAPDVPVLHVPDEGPYAAAQAEAEERGLEEEIDNAIEGIRKAAGETAAAVEEAIESFTDGLKKDEDA